MTTVKTLKIKPMVDSLRDVLKKNSDDKVCVVFAFKDNLNKQFVMVNWKKHIFPSYDGDYTRQDVDYVALSAVEQGKRGAKVHSVYLNDMSSMSDKGRKPVSASNIVPLGTIKLKVMPEVVKVIEKVGWALA